MNIEMNEEMRKKGLKEGMNGYHMAGIIITSGRVTIAIGIVIIVIIGTLAQLCRNYCINLL